jgi:hypothetical protein
MKRRNFLFKSALALAAAAIIPSQLRTAYAIAGGDLTNGITPFIFDPTKDIIPAPENPEEKLSDKERQILKKIQKKF